MAKRGDFFNPQFETRSGVLLELKPIPQRLSLRFLLEWKKKNPPPKAPVKILENGDEWENKGDERYIVEYQMWQGALMFAQRDYILRSGVKTDPPKSWEPDPDLANSNDDKRQLRALWLNEILSPGDVLLNEDGEPELDENGSLQFENDELEQLVDAIQGILQPTAKGLEESKKD